MLNAASIELYESLRRAVLAGQPAPAGLSAVVFHGLMGGAAVLARESAVPALPSAPRESRSVSRATDPALVRVMANMVLQAHRQVQHVY